MKRTIAALALLACVVVAPRSTAAEWGPPDVRTTVVTLDAVVKANAAATGTAEASYAQRRERWTYHNGERSLAVRVVVRGDDFRATVTLGEAEYAGGRSAGTRWRADANGVTHATWSESQGDAIDRLPQSLFPFALSECTLAGESKRFGAPAWVLVDRPPRDKPHWFYVDETSGLITHEVTREGKRAVVTSFSDFKVVAGTRRPYRWHISDGDSGNDLDVSVDDVERETLSERDVAIPQTQRLFGLASPGPSGAVVLPTTFRGENIYINVAMGRQHIPFVLDTGTASITLERSVAQRVSSGVVLEHATVPTMTAGPLSMSNVSTLAIPAFVQGILGYDFFLGHVLHIDYLHRRVEVLTPPAADRVFSDPKNRVFDASFDEGIPLLRGAFGSASGERFALDTGSQPLVLLAPFLRRNPQLDKSLTPTHFGLTSHAPATEEFDYLEGPIVVAAREAPSFQFGPILFKDVFVAAEVPKNITDAIDIPIDGIVGTDLLSKFEWWFDYDGGRIAVRRNSR